MSVKKEPGRDQRTEPRSDAMTASPTHSKDNTGAVVCQLKCSRSDALEIAQEIAPKFDFPLLSKCLRPAVYGIRPIEAIERRIFEKRPVKEKRRLPHMFTWRCDTALRERLQTVKSHYRATTNQEILTVAVLMLCEHDERKRRDEM